MKCIVATDVSRFRFSRGTRGLLLRWSLVISAATFLFVASAIAQAADPIDAATMQRVHDEVKTPFKYGVVLRGD